MKKLLASLLALLLLCSAAYAWEGEYSEEIWFNYADTTWPNSFYEVPMACIQICVPDPLQPVEVQDWQYDYGIIAMFQTDAGECMFVKNQYVFDDNGDLIESLFGYYEYLCEQYVQMDDADMVLLNGIPAFIYTDVDLDERYVCLMFPEALGQVVTVGFTHATSHPEFMEMTAETIPSIMELTY